MSKGLTRRINRRREKKKHEVEFYTYPKFLFCWPLILMGFVLWTLDYYSMAGTETLAWIWAITLLVVMVTVGFDLSRNYTFFWLVLIGGIWFMVIWLRDVKSVRIFSDIYNFFANLDPKLTESVVTLRGRHDLEAWDPHTGKSEPLHATQ